MISLFFTVKEKTKKVIINNRLIGFFELLPDFPPQKIFKFFKQNAVANLGNLHYFRFESHSFSRHIIIIVFPIFGLLFQLFIEE